jgi:hypothetical protein
LSKKQNLPAPKFCLFAGTQALCVRSFACRDPVFFIVVAASGRTRSLKSCFSFCKELDVRTLCFAAARTQPQNTSKAEPAIKLA